MSGFVMTKGAQGKSGVAENFVSLTYTAHKKKQKDKVESPPSEIKPYNHREVDPKIEQEKLMKRTRWEVMKFAAAGSEKKTKYKTKVALAIELGARPPRNRRMNYKTLKHKRNKEKLRAATEDDDNKFKKKKKIMKKK